MNNKIKILLFFCISFSVCRISAQTNHVETSQGEGEMGRRGEGVKASLGHSYNPAKKASGYMITLEFHKKAGAKGMIGLEAGHFFNNSRGILPRDLSNTRFVIRDFTHFEPLGEDNNPFGWTETSFPGIRLPSRPDKYFNFNIGVKYLTELSKNTKRQFQAGFGLALSYRDEMELTKVIKAANIQATIPPFSGTDYLIPIFSYNTYLDFALIPEVNCQLPLGKNRSLGLKGQFLYYPVSQNCILASAVTFGFGL